MCLGVPGRVLERNGLTAVVDCWGARREVSLLTVDEPIEAGDYVLVHVGFAIRKIPAEQAGETVAFYDLLINGSDADLMAMDINGELAAAKPRTLP